MAEQVMAEPQQQSVDPAIQQISDFISQAITQGQNPAEVVMSLVEQQVDQQTIGQALMMNGFEENDIMSLFQEMSQGQQPKEGAGGQPDTIGELNRNPEELTEDERMHADDMSVEETNEPGMSLAKSGIEIKPENEGKFTRWAEARGMSVQEAANKVMSNTDEYPPAVVKMANFAKNAAGWKHEYGGESYQMGGTPQGKVAAVNNVSVGNNNMHWQKAPLYITPMDFETTNKDFSLGKAAAVLYGGYKEFLSGDDANKDGIKDGFFRDSAKKSAIRDANKGNYYNYKITQDANDPNKYAADNLDLYNASKNQGSLRTVDQYKKDIADNSRFNYDINTHDYNFITSSRPIDERIYNSAAQKNAIAGKDYNYISAMDPATKAMIMSGKNDPTGVRMGIDKYGSGMSYLPGSNNPYEYNTYMGINKVGQSSMIPTGDTGQPIPGMINTRTAQSIPGFVDGMGLTETNSEFKYGGNLDKAQFGIPDGFDFNDPFGLNKNRFGQTANYGDTQGYTNNQSNSAPQNTISLTDEQVANNNGMYNGYAFPDVAPVKPVIPVATAFGQPKVERTNKLEGGLNRFLDSPGVQGYAKVSDFVVQGAGVVNDYFRDKAVNQAKEDNFNKLGADYQYATAEDPFNKRGLWDVNTGTAGSEGDRTTGLYMSKYGGENKTIDVDTNLLAKLIAAGADIEIL